MKDRLRIEPGALPEEGKQLTGELDEGVFGLSEQDARPLGPLEYELWAQRFEGELLLTGRVAAKFEFTCVVTLKEFVKTIVVDPAAISLEIEGQSVMDVTEALREEILIQFPLHPRCDEGDEPEECEIDLRYLSVDKSPADELTTSPRAGGDDRWSALDNLPNLKDQP